jgi:hypothetical protein
METHMLKIIVFAFDLFTWTESVAALGSFPATPAQALSMILAGTFPASKSIAGTTETLTLSNGSTTAGTFTLNSSSNPTAITRAT